MVRSESEAGWPHFLEHLMFRAGHPDQRRDWALRMDRLGGEVQASTDREWIHIGLATTPRDFPEAQSFLFDLVSPRPLPEKALPIERRVILNEIDQIEDDPEEWIWDYALSRCVADPVGYPVLGTRSSVRGISLGPLEQFYDRSMASPKTLVLSGRGVSREEVLRLWESYRARSAPPQAARRLRFRSPERTEVVRRDRLQCHLLGLVCVEEPLDLASTLGIQVLMYRFGGANSSVLFQKIREDAGLCYSIQAGFVPLLGQGVIYVQAATQPRNRMRLIDAVEREWESLTQDLVAEDWEFYRRSLVSQIQVLLDRGDFRVELFYALDRMGVRGEAVSAYLNMLQRLDYEECMVDLRRRLGGKSLRWFVVSPESR